MNYVCAHCGVPLSKRAVEVVELNKTMERQGTPPSDYLAKHVGACTGCGSRVSFEDLERQRGEASSLVRSVMSRDLELTKKTISAAACVYKNRHPHLEFREALERSLLETRPGWDERRLKRLSSEFDRANTEDEMVALAARDETEARRERWNVLGDQDL